MRKIIILAILLMALFSILPIHAYANGGYCKGYTNAVGYVRGHTKATVGWLHHVRVGTDYAFIAKLRKYPVGHRVVVTGMACFDGTMDKTYRVLHATRSRW